MRWTFQGLVSVVVLLALVIILLLLLVLLQNVAISVGLTGSEVIFASLSIIVAPVVATLVVLFAGALRWIWQSPKGGFGVTPGLIGIGVLHGLELRISPIDAQATSLHRLSARTYLPVKFVITNTLDRLVRIRSLTVDVVKDTLIHRQIFRCDLLEESGQTVVFDYILAPLVDSKELTAFIWLDASPEVLAQARLSFRFNLERVGLNPRIVHIERGVSQWRRFLKVQN